MRVEDGYLTADEAAAYLRLAPGTLANRRSFGGGPPFLKLGAKVVYRCRDLDAWATARRRESTSDAKAGRGWP